MQRAGWSLTESLPNVQRQRDKVTLGDTFEVVAREWLKHMENGIKASTLEPTAWIGRQTQGLAPNFLLTMARLAQRFARVYNSLPCSPSSPRKPG
jgi:hypothetical protein